MIQFPGFLIALSLPLVVISYCILSVKSYNRFVSDPFDPLFIFMIFLLVFFFNNAVFFGYQYSIWTAAVVFIGTVSFIAGNIVLWKVIRFTDLKIVSIGPSSYSAFFIILGLSILVLFVKLRFYDTTLLGYISNMLLFHATNIKSGGYFWKVLEKLLYFGMLYVSINKVAKIPTLRTIVIVCFFLLAFNIVNLSHSRWDYIQIFLIGLLLWMLIIKQKPQFKFYWLIALPFVPVIMIVLNILRHGRKIDSDFSGVAASLDSLKGDSGPGVFLDKFVTYFVDTEAYNYGEFAIYQLFALVPRVVWQDKPVTSSLIYYTFEIMGEDPYLDGSTYTYTVFDFFGVYHFVSLVLGMFLFGILCRYLYNQVYLSRSFCFKVFCVIFIANLFNTYRGSFLDQITLIEVDILVLVVFYLLFERFRFKL